MNIIIFRKLDSEITDAAGVSNGPFHPFPNV